MINQSNIIRKGLSETLMMAHMITHQWLCAEYILFNGSRHYLSMLPAVDIAASDVTCSQHRRIRDPCLLARSSRVL